MIVRTRRVLDAIRDLFARNCRIGMVLGLLLLTFGMGHLAHAQVRLSDSEMSNDLWPQAQVFFDATGALTVDDVRARAPEFQRVGRNPANLGRRSGAVWVRVPLLVPTTSAQAEHPQDRPKPTVWLLEVDYAPLDRIDVYLYEGDRLVQRAVMGDHLAPAQRPQAERAHVVALDLPAGQARWLFLRIETTGSMIAPISVLTHAQYALLEAREQVLQGLIAGAGLILLLYSLSHWASTRDMLFGWYALTLIGTVGFFAALSGVGPQHVWADSEWMVRNGPPFTILLGVCGAFLFVRRALDLPTHAPRTAKFVLAGGILAGGTALAFLAGAIDYVTAQGVGMALGPSPLVLVLPTAFRRARAGDRAALLLLLGWGVYSIGVLSIVGLLAGWLPVSYWSLHGFQFASIVEMTTWMLLLADRVQEIQRRALLLQQDRDRLHSLAHTDGLTGLLNRRGLQQAVQAPLAAAGSSALLALYLMDLDGFKQVNDSLGHEAGDDLLRGVATRLRQAVRASDLVCRLGGDEFVLVATGLHQPQDAQLLGEKLLQAFEPPFPVQGQLCRVGLTVGYALAPQDAVDLEHLLERADQAMYAGKRAGKQQVRRAAAAAEVAV